MDTRTHRQFRLPFPAVEAAGDEPRLEAASAVMSRVRLTLRKPSRIGALPGSLASMTSSQEWQMLEPHYQMLAAIFRAWGPRLWETSPSVQELEGGTLRRAG